MKIRTAADVMAIAKARGFKIVVDPGPPPMPMLRFKATVEMNDKATDALKAALKVCRRDIIKAVLEENAESENLFEDIP